MKRFRVRFYSEHVKHLSRSITIVCHATSFEHLIGRLNRLLTQHLKRIKNPADHDDFYLYEIKEIEGAIRDA